jgi:hypothetical protein
MQAVSVLLIGLGIGWLTGLSLSPVVSGVLTSLLGIAAGTVVGLRTVKKSMSVDQGSQRQSVDARPVALLVLGVALAAPCGILARTYRIFEPTHATTSFTSTKPTNREISTDNAKIGSRSQAFGTGALFVVDAEQCNELLLLSKQENAVGFVNAFENSDLPGAASFVSRLPNPKTLKVIAEVLCTND